MSGLIVCSILMGCASVAAHAVEGNEPVEVTLDKARKRTSVEIGELRWRIELLGINDSRCPANAKCIWVGELAARMRIERVKSAEEPGEISLGQLTSPSVELMGARLELVSIDETSVTFTVKAAEQD